MRSGVWICASLLIAACAPPNDENISDPPPGTPPSVTFTYKAETSVVYLSFQGEDRILAAYNDQSGLYSARA